MIVIINYRVGNLLSIANMLKRTGYREVYISDKIEDIKRADKLILPGVGHFDYGMKQLRQASFFESLNQRILENKVPILGICLGAQLLTQGSEEGEQPGLGWIQARTIRFDSSRMDPSLKIPHMGWGDVKVQKPSKLFENMPEDPRFYFVHSYHLVCDDPTDELVSSTHGYSFVAGVERGNVLGVQFHPEKSHKYGLQLLSNFVNHY